MSEEKPQVERDYPKITAQACIKIAGLRAVGALLLLADDSDDLSPQNYDFLPKNFLRDLGWLIDETTTDLLDLLGLEERRARHGEDSQEAR